MSLAGEVAGQHASNINGSGSDLTLVSYLFGPSYAFYHYRHLVPFGGVLLGGAHADGSLAPSNNGLNGSSDDFALLTGGGLDFPVGEHLSLRAARVDYYLTHVCEWRQRSPEQPACQHGSGPVLLANESKRKGERLGHRLRVNLGAQARLLGFPLANKV